jgi:hypothetical protein
MVNAVRQIALLRGINFGSASSNVTLFLAPRTSASAWARKDPGFGGQLVRTADSISGRHAQ